MTGHEFSKNKRPIALRLWLSVIEPGYLRLLSAGRAALAVLSIWMIIRTAMRLKTAGNQPPVALFGVLSGLIFLLFIIDLKPADRKISLLLATQQTASQVQGLQSYIHDNVSILTGFLTQNPDEGAQTQPDLHRQVISQITLDEILTADTGSEEAVRNRAMYHLARIHDTILQIAAGLGVPDASR